MLPPTSAFRSKPVEHPGTGEAHAAVPVPNKFKRFAGLALRKATVRSDGGEEPGEEAAPSQKHGESSRIDENPTPPALPAPNLLQRKRRFRWQQGCGDRVGGGGDSSSKKKTKLTRGKPHCYGDASSPT